MGYTLEMKERGTIKSRFNDNMFEIAKDGQRFATITFDAYLSGYHPNEAYDDKDKIIAWTLDKIRVVAKVAYHPWAPSELRSSEIVSRIGSGAWDEIKEAYVAWWHDVQPEYEAAMRVAYDNDPVHAVCAALRSLNVKIAAITSFNAYMWGSSKRVVMSYESHSRRGSIEWIGEKAKFKMDTIEHGVSYPSKVDKVLGNVVLDIADYDKVVAKTNMRAVNSKIIDAISEMLINSMKAAGLQPSEYPKKETSEYGAQCWVSDSKNSVALTVQICNPEKKCVSMHLGSSRIAMPACMPTFAFGVLQMMLPSLAHNSIAIAADFELELIGMGFTWVPSPTMDVNALR